MVEIKQVSAKFRPQFSSTGLRLALLSVTDHSPIHQPNQHPPGIVVLHFIEYLFTIDHLMKVVVLPDDIFHDYNLQLEIFYSMKLEILEPFSKKSQIQIQV